jgi:heptaprenyl diphosphate synthase
MMATDYEMLRKDIDYIKNQVYEKLKNNYLLKYTNVPMIDDDKVLLLYMMYKEKRIAKISFEDYIVTIMLVQVALDTHEQISIHELNDDQSRKNRQLTVLAGDFYSGLYYQMLSELQDILMVRTLAQGIQEVNENKMQFYCTEKQQIENAIENIRRIEATLLLKTADSLHLPLWKGIAEEFLFIKRLLLERSEFQAGNLTPLFIKITKQLQIDKGKSNYKKQVLQIIDDYLRIAHVKIEKFLMEHPIMENVLKVRLDTLFKTSGFMLEKTVEEG